MAQDPSDIIVQKLMAEASAGAAKFRQLTFYSEREAADIIALAIAPHEALVRGRVSGVVPASRMFANARRIMHRTVDHLRDVISRTRNDVSAVKGGTELLELAECAANYTSTAGHMANVLNLVSRMAGNASTIEQFRALLEKVRRDLQVEADQAANNELADRYATLFEKWCNK